MSVRSAELGYSIRIVSLVGAAHMMSHVYAYCLPPLANVVVADGGYSYTEIGLVISAFSVATALGQVPIGFLVDRIGGRRVLLAGLIVQSLAICSAAFSQSYWMLLLSFTVAGTAHAVYHPADYAILSRAIPEGRLARAFTLHSASGNLGNAIAPMLLIALAALWDWRAAFLLIGMVGVALFFALLPFSAILESPGPAAEPTARPRQGGGPQTGVALLFSPPILLCFSFFVVMAMAVNGVRAFAPSALVEMGASSLATANGAVTGFILGGAAGILVGGVIADRFGPRNLTAVVGLIGAGVLLIAVGTVSLPVLLLVAVLTAAGLLRGIVQGTRDLIVHAATPTGEHGKVFAFVSTGGHIGMAVVPPVFGWAIDTGRPDLIFAAGGVLLIVALASFVAVRGRTPGRG